MPRAFLAIELPPDVRATFVACRECFLEQDPEWRGEKWVAPENLHLTLRFLGTIPDTYCSELTDRARDALADLAPYTLRLDRPRAIPGLRSASLLWVAPSEGGEETAELAVRLAAASSFIDFEPDNRTFRSHVTLCRARKPRRVRSTALDELDRALARADDRAVCMSVRQVTLFASTLTPRGPVYEQLAAVPLGM